MKILKLALILMLFANGLFAGESDPAPTREYPYLGPYGSLIDQVVAAKKNFKTPVIDEEHRRKVKEILTLPGFDNDALPQEIKIERTWSKDGVDGIEYSWNVGYGPRTYAWLLRPQNVKGTLPGVVALHDHGGFKTLGKEKIADGPDEMLPGLDQFREQYYGGRAYASELAKQGFTVLVPDVFMWGSRKHSAEHFSPGAKWVSNTMEKYGELGEAWTSEIREYEMAAGLTERQLDQYLRTAGTSLAAVIAYEDRLAVNFLVSLDQYVQPGGVGCVGLSGGGARSSLLQGSCNHIRAAVVVGMMSTYDELITRYIETHTSMLFPERLTDFGDWPDIAGARAPSKLMVLYDSEDQIFSLKGMKDADKRLRDIYIKQGVSQNYHGEFFPGPHKFDQNMQEIAFDWLKRNVGND